MKNGLKFTLSGDMACFRKPETNSSVYLSYSIIHKIAVMGILGAVIGLKGYNQSGKNQIPEFYEKLESLKIAIVAPKKNILQQMISFNNSTGLASSHEGGNLIVKENVLCNPSWDIYIMEDDSDEYAMIKDYLLNNKVEYIPYLGRNDYPASFSNVEEVEFCDITDEILIYDSIVTAELKDCVKSDNLLLRNIKKYLMHEKLPVQLHKESYHYIYESFLNTNELVHKKDNSYCCNKINLQFI